METSVQLVFEVIKFVYTHYCYFNGFNCTSQYEFLTNVHFCIVLWGLSFLHTLYIIALNLLLKPILFLKDTFLTNMIDVSKFFAHETFID